MEKLKTSLEGRVFRISFNREDAHNAIDPEMISEMTKIFKAADKDPKIRVIVIDSKGKTFCAGADLNWMRNSINDPKKKNLKSANDLYVMYKQIFQCSKPVIAKIQGSAFGGGVGLIACCDIGIMTDGNALSLSELKLGLIPSTIIPFFIRKIGLPHTRFYGLSSRKIPASECKQIGLVNEVVANQAELDLKTKMYCDSMMELSPKAIRRFKNLCNKVESYSIQKAQKLTSDEIADIRTTPEAQEGILAFFEKRKPNWS